jgi:5-methylcytosine-specific restriction endonuclease McrA
MGGKGWGKYNQAARNLYKRYIARGVDFDYNIWLELTSSVCHYCGSPPSNIRRHPSNDVYLYNGLDRKSPHDNYTLDNVVPCCWRCNKMKSDTPYDEFLSLLKKILVNLNYE